MLPGLTTTRAAAIVFDIGKLVLSAMRMLPPLFSYTGFTSDIRKITGSVPPHSTPAATWSASRSPGSSPGKIQRLCRGMSSKTSWATAKFFASTSGGVCANQSVSSSVLLSDWETVIEHDDEFRAVRAGSLQGVRQPGREEPEVFLEDVLDARLAFPAERRDPALALRHDRPLGGLVPVQLTDAARLQVHVHAGDLFGNREVLLRDLARPAPALLTAGGDVERGPEERLRADVRTRR